MPFCVKCGSKLPTDATFCPNCGAPVAPKVAAPVEPKALSTDRSIEFNPNLVKSLERAGSGTFSLSPDGLLALKEDAEKIVVMNLVDGGKQELLFPYRSIEARHDVRDLAFSSDGKKLASIHYSSQPEESKYAIWDSATWNILFKASFKERLEDVIFSKLASWSFSDFRGRLENISPTCITLSPTGDKLAVGNQYGEIYLVDVQSSKVTALGGHGPSVVPAPFGDYVNFTTFNHDEEKLFSGGDDARVIVWNIAGSGRERSGELLGVHDWTVSSGALSPDGSILATSNLLGGGGVGYSGKEGTIKIWDIPRGKALKKLRGGASELSFTDTGHLLAYNSVEDEKHRVVGGFIRVWRTDNWKLETTIELESRFFKEIFSSGGKYLAGQLFGEGLEIWSLY